jgi:hypothetical protein
MTPQLIAASAKLKIGLKNIKLSPPNKWHPTGPVKFKKRKIEHIDNFSV